MASQLSGPEATGVIEALEEVARTVAVHREQTERRLEDLARCVHEEGGPEARRVRRRIDALLIRPTDPLELGWNPFQMLGLSEEPNWTQWLASALRGDGACAGLMWRSLCDAICCAAGPSRAPHPFATAEDWRRARSVAGLTVHDEYAHPIHGRVDLVVESPNLLLVLENKLWSGWSDTPGAPLQSDRYRALGLELRRATLDAGRASEAACVGLVLLSAEREFAVPSEWVHVCYAGLARAIRQNLAPIGAAGDPTALLGAAPAFATVHAIECELLGLSPAALRSEPRWQDLPALARIEAHLSEESNAS